LDNIFAGLSEMQRERERESHGITNENGYDGVSRLKIPYIYYKIIIKYDSYYCEKDGLITVYNKDGEELFTSNDVSYCKEDMFLVKIIDEEILPADWGYALYHKSKKITDDIFKPFRTHSFNDCGFMEVGLADEYMAKLIINKKGDIVNTAENYFDSYLLQGVLLKTNKGYLNLLTNKYICKPHYSCSGSIDNDECLFIKTESTCVYQVNFRTGEFVIHGNETEKEKPKTEEEIKIEKEIKDKENEKLEDARMKRAKEFEQWNMLSRNENCLCGSKKKFKKCCIGNWGTKLKEKYETT